MKQWWQISPHKIVAGLIGWLLATNLLIWLHWWPFKVVLFVCIALLPGTALLRLLQITLRTFPARVLYSFGLSLLVLMLSGLAANTLFGFMDRPLELPGILLAWNATVGLIILAGAFTNRTSVRVERWTARGFGRSAYLLTGASLLLPVGAVLGAFRLNNGGDALVAVLALCYTTALIVCTFLLRRRVPDGLLIWLVFTIGLSVLLMTSLRGWDIVGHDIEREFRVYTLTHLHGYWNIALDRNPYNACLSITILPQMLASLLHVSGLVVFKVILQVIFAACPAVMYLLLRQYLPKLGAFCGSLLFICYPTFINDSAMLTRQSVAYLFFALALLMMTNKIQKVRYKVLFLLFALGAILSHYSTAYVFVGLFGMAVLCKLAIMWWQRRRAPAPLWAPTVLSPLYVGLLFLMAFIWYTPITGTASGLVATLRSSLINIPKAFSDDNKSTDTSAVLLFSGGKTQTDLYEGYLSSSWRGGNSRALDRAFIPNLTTDDLPLTPLGKKARSAGINPSIITTLRQSFARVLQLLALAGVMYAAYRLLRRKSDAISADFVCLSVAGIILLTLLVVLPVLSINYGILRAFHQALIFLILPMMLLIAWAGRYMWGRLRTAIAAVGFALLFLTFSGVFAQMLGGVGPSLSMNNRGLYYGLYYSPAADSRAFKWLKEHVPHGSDVRAANFNRAFMHDPNYPFSGIGVLPSQISADTFVYLDPAQVQRQKLYANYESSPLIIAFPLEYYDRAKDQIYSTTSTRVYR